MKKVLIICPTSREYRDLPAIAAALNYELIFEEFGGDYFDNALSEDHSDGAQSFDILPLIEDLIRRYKDAGLSGVTSPIGYPGMSVASIVAERLGLFGTPIKCVLLCEHKYYSRIAQQALVPAAIPSFHLLDTKANGLNHATEFPLFVKPVKANFSINANTVSTQSELQRAVRSCSLPERFTKPFDDLLKAYTDFQHGASNHLLAESLLEGVQVSLEGYVSRGEVRVIGIIDAVMYPGTISFERFVYPSRLSEDVQRRMARIAETFMGGIGYDNALFNVELMYNPATERISIIEVNPKIASQFTDLFEKVDGTSSYSLLLQVAAGDEPTFQHRRGEFKLAASCVLRTFEDRRVRGVPSQEQLDAVLDKFPDARVEICASQGKLLSDGMQDGKSYRYGLINIGADSEEALTAKLECCRSMLDFKFAPV